MEELRSWWEVPSIAHFCSLFRAAFDLPDFDIEDLEECLFAFCEDQESPFVIDLICRLLRGCYGRKDIESFNYEVYLKDIFKYRAATEENFPNPFEDSDFKSLDLRTKVEVLHRLCDYRLDAEDVMDQLKGLDGDNMRVSALGSDDSGAAYWYFYGNRLYKEDPDPEPVIVEENPKKKKKEKKEPDKNKKKKGKQKKKEVETPRSSRGRALSKTKHYRPSESEEESSVEEEEEEEEEFITPVKQQKSQGRQSRSTRKSRETNEQKDEERKDIGTRRSTRRSSTQITPVVEKKTRGRGRKSAVNGNVSDEDSDDEWNTPLAKTITKNKTPTPSKGRSSRKRRQQSVESSDHETEDASQVGKSEDTDHPKRKRGRPRQAVKITPDSSVNGDVDDRSMDYIDENSRDGSNQISSSTQNNRDDKREDKNEDVDKEAVTEASMDDPTKTEDSKVKDTSVEEDKVDSVNDMKVKDESEEKDETSIQCESKELINEEEEEKGKAEKTGTEHKGDDQSNVNNNHDLNSQETDKKEEVKSEAKPEMELTNVKVENSEMIDVEGNNSDYKTDNEVKVGNKPPPKPLYKNPRWHLVCSTLEDWQALADTLKDSNSKAAKDLCKCIVSDFLPEMPAILEARERDKKRRQAEMAPRRVSARITMKMKEFQEQERILEEARQMEEKARKEDEEEKERLKELERQEEEKKMREERQRAREERQKRLELREYRAQLIAEGKELPPELIYTGNTTNSKYREDDDRCELDKETLEDMEKMLEEIKSHKDSWPFMDPVEEEIAPGYHDIVKRPMDLSSIEKKLNNGSYRTTKRFVMDFNLMINNCFQFSGAESELGRMATRLRRCINRCVKIYVDKDDGDDDEDFHGTVQTQTEKKWRPRRAATSRAMDTLRGAFDDDEFEEEMTSTPGHEYAAKPQKKRLIPELSGEAVQKSRMLNGDRDAKAEAANSQTLKQSSDTVTKETKILTVNGKTFVYKFNTSASNTTKPRIIEKSLDISASPDKTNKLNHAAPRNTVYRNQSHLTAASNSPARNSPLLVSPRQSSAILPASSMSTNPSGTLVNTPNGPKIIQIMSPTALNQGKSTTQPVVAATNTPSKAIRISDGMLLLNGKPTGIHISGKTKIIYKGAVTSGSSATPEQNAIIVSSGQTTTGLSTGSTTQSGIVLSSGGAATISGQNAIRVVPGSSNLSNNSNNLITQLNPLTGQSAIIAANPIQQTKPTQSLLVGNQMRLVQPGSIQQVVASGNQQTGSIQQLVVGGNQQTGSIQQLVVGGNQQTGSIQQLVVGGNQQTGSIQQLVVAGNQQTGSIQQLPVVIGGNQQTGVIQQLVVSRSQATGPVQSLVVGSNQSTGTLQQLVVSGTQVTGSLQPNVVSGVQSVGPVVVQGSQTNTSNTVQPSLISSTTTPSQAIKTIQPATGRLGDSVGQIPSVCERVIASEQIVDSSSTSKTIVNLPLVTVTPTVAQTLSSSVGSNEMSTFPPYVLSTVNKPEQSGISNKPTVQINTPGVKANVPGGVSLLSKLQTSNEVSLLQTSPKSNESLMGPPLLVPPKRKLSGSPENNSTSPPKLACLGTSALNTTSSQNTTLINSSVVSNSTETPKTSESVSGSSDQQFPPYKISHSSPDKGNLFDILKTNVVDSSSQDNVLSSSSNDSGLSQGLMNKVSTFAANLHSKSLAGKISIPGHMLQKSPTKEQPVLEQTEENWVTINSIASDSSIQGQDPS